LLGGLVAAPETFAAFGGDGPLNTDDHPTLEFEAPADRFRAALYFETLHTLMSSTGRIHVEAGPLARDRPPADAVRADGFAPTRGLPDGKEIERGVTVVTQPQEGEEQVDRWVLVGREFESDAGRTGLHRLTNDLTSPEEVREVATAFAGPGLVSRAPIKV